MEYLKIHNWEKWQTYRKDRSPPPWIKAYHDLLGHAKWAALTDAEKGHLLAMWLLARNRNGAIPADPKIIQKLCSLDKPPNIKKFQQLQFVNADGNQVVTKWLPSGCQDDAPEAEAEAEKNKKAEYPSWLNQDLWKDFKKHRTKLKASLTEKAEQLLLKKLTNLKKQGYNPDKIIEQSIYSGWKGLFPLKEKEIETSTLPDTTTNDPCVQCGKSKAVFDGLCRKCYTGMSDDQVTQKIGTLVDKAFKGKEM